MSNTSPICYLTMIGHLELLPALFGQVTVPPAVHQELCDPAAPQPVREQASAPPPWLEIRAATTATDAALNRLQPGEREAILLAEELGADLVILDEAAARQVARARGLNVTGLLGVLAEGAARRMIDLPEAVARLRQTNFRASPSLLKAVLDREVPPAVDLEGKENSHDP